MYTQNQIIEKMRELGYDANEGGVCFGLTHMEIQAILIGQQKVFDDRLRLILEEPDLEYKIDEARENVRNLDKNQKPSEEDRQYLEILSFFEGIMLYQDELSSTEWFSETQPLKVSKFLQSIELDKTEGEAAIIAVYSVPEVYTESELSSYLEKMSKILETMEESDKIPIKIMSLNHAMLITYDSNTKQWHLYDPNQLLKEPINKREIAREIMNGFKEHPITKFQTNIYSTKKYAEKYNLNNPFNTPHLMPEQNNARLMYTAIIQGNLEVIEKLLDSGVKVNKNYKDGYTALSLAIQYDRPETVQYLISKRASLTLADYNDHSALHLAAKQGRLEILNILLNNGAQAKFANNRGFTALHLAAQYNQIDIIKALIEHDPSVVDQVTKLGHSALYLAADNGHLDIAYLLLQKGANPNLQIFKESAVSLLHLAAHEGHLEIVKFLLAIGAKPDLKNEAGFTALHYAALNNHPKVVKALLKHHASIDLATTHEKFTALHLAAAKGNIAIVNNLLNHGANFHLRNSDELTARDLAKMNNQPEAAEAIKKAIKNPALLFGGPKTAKPRSDESSKDTPRIQPNK